MQKWFQLFDKDNTHYMDFAEINSSIKFQVNNLPPPQPRQHLNTIVCADDWTIKY